MERHQDSDIRITGRRQQRANAYIYDEKALDLPRPLLVAVEGTVETIFGTLLESIKPLDETARYLFLSLISSFGDRLNVLCREVGGNTEMIIPTCPASETPIKPEIVDLPERTIMEVEALTDAIGRSAIRIIKGLSSESSQHDVIALLVSFNERLRSLIGNYSIQRPYLTDFTATFQLTSRRADALATGKTVDCKYPKAISVMSGSRVRSNYLKAAEKRNFTLTQAINMLNEPEALAKDDLRDIYYFLLVKTNANVQKDSTKLMADLMRRDLATIMRIKTERIPAISRNSHVRAYSREGTYTCEDIRVIRALKTIAERLQRVEEHAPISSSGSTAE